MKKTAASIPARLVTAILIVAVVASMAISAGGPTARAYAADARSESPFGVCSHMLWGFTNAEIDRELDAAAKAGVRWLRIDVSWRDLETADNTYNTTLLSKLDYVLTGAAKRNITVMAVVMEVPNWANGGKGMWAPPTNDAKFGEFMRYLSAKATRIRYWELANEVNETEFWGVARSGSPARYTSFLKAGYQGVKTGNPNALVITAGLAGSDDQYLQEMYDAGAKGYFDIVGVHAYTRGRSPYAVDLNTPSSTYDGLAIMKSTMDRNGDSAKKIWITETGWQNSTAGHFVTQAQAAQNVYDAFKRVTEDFPYVETAFIYNIRDNGTDPTIATDNYGLMKHDFSAKPALASYRKAYEDFWVARQPVTPPPSVDPSAPPSVDPTTTPPSTTPTPTPPPAKHKHTRVTVQVVFKGQALRNATVVFMKKGSTARYSTRTNRKGVAGKYMPRGSYSMKITYRGKLRVKKTYTWRRPAVKLRPKVRSIS